MKILNVMLGAGQGGLEYSFVHYTRTFSEMGYTSAVLCHKNSPYIAEFKKDKNIPLFTTTACIWNPYAWLRIIKAIKTFKPDILCLQGNRAIHFGASRLLKLFIRPFPIIMATTHNARNKLFYKLDGMYAITQYLRNNLINDFGIPAEKVFDCPHSVPCPNDKMQYKLHKPVTIGFLGRLETVKGCDVLLEACCKLKNQDVPFCLIIAGEGSLMEKYKQFVSLNGLENNIKFIGWIKDKNKFFSDIDILCLPSRSEGQPLTLLEGLAYAKPAVVSSCPGMMEVIAHKNCGLVFDIENADQLAEKLSYMIKNPKLCKELSDKAYETFSENYNIDVQKRNLNYGIEQTLKNKK
ncbi:MAG: glycosyltransferase family 4 protein [Alphaproteobacteria bacterium]|nr:glycosyltransferase family 4 protein [Alphaproteobacteria bacterium]